MLTTPRPEETPPTSAIAAAFDLGRPTHELALLQVASFVTWRLVTDRRAFVVKRLWPGDDDPALVDQHRGAMHFEQRVIGSGVVRTPRPVEPREPSFGWAAPVGRFGTFRVSEWIDHRPLEEADDITDWFGETMAALHRLAPLGATFVPVWRWLGVHPRSTWQRWIGVADATRRSWAPLLDSMADELLDFSDRIVHAYRSATDLVVSHADVGPYNVLMSTDGPVLIDWESVGPVRASSEVGRAAEVFSGGFPAPMRTLLDAYRRAGGSIASRPDDLFLGILTNDLANVSERIMVALGEDVPASWMDEAGLDRDIEHGLRALPNRIRALTDLGVATLSGS